MAQRSVMQRAYSSHSLACSRIGQTRRGNFARSGGYDKDMGEYDFALLRSKDGERSLNVMAVLCV